MTLVSLRRGDWTIPIRELVWLISRTTRQTQRTCPLHKLQKSKSYLTELTQFLFIRNFPRWRVPQLHHRITTWVKSHKMRKKLRSHNLEILLQNILINLMIPLISSSKSWKRPLKLPTSISTQKTSLKSIQTIQRLQVCSTMNLRKT